MKRKSVTKVVFCLFLILLFSFSYSQNNIEKKIYNTKATTSPPAIDGLENDVCWKTVEWSSDFIQFRSNLVVRWEYLPGSTLYLVWSQGRTSSNIN